MTNFGAYVEHERTCKRCQRGKSCFERQRLWSRVCHDPEGSPANDATAAPLTGDLIDEIIARR